MTVVAAPALHWYVIHTKPKQEERAEANLNAWAIETFTPKLRELRSSSSYGGPSYRVSPLFPGCLFAHFGGAELLEKVRLTRGVHSVVGFGECATPVEDSVIALVRSRVQDDGLVHLAEPSPGDRVEIISGPLRSLSGIFERCSNSRERVMILLATVGAVTHVQVARTSIRPVRAVLPVSAPGLSLARRERVPLR